MLSPDELEEAGERVAQVYRQVEAELLAHLARAIASGEGVTSRTSTAVALLSQTHAAEMRRMVAAHAEEVSDAVYAIVEEALAASDADDVRRVGGGPAWPRQMEATARGVAAILERDNLQMVEGARQAYLDASIEAITLVNSGAYTADKALRHAVRRLEREGVSFVQYQNAATGARTVRNRADVAVKRHVRTQIAQDGARMTEERMARLGVELVEVSSHEGARPDHAAWQGRVYGLNGPTVVDGKRYPGLRESTGYGTVSGLLGANCRHSFGPWRPGTPRAYGPDPRHASGLPNGEVYALTQRQRARERAIRADKRELAGMQALYGADPSLGNLAAVQGAKERLARDQRAMRELIASANARSRTGEPVLHRDPRREWAGDMPKGSVPKGSGRKLDEFLATPSAERSLRSSGVSKAAARRAVVEELAAKGGKTADFAALPASGQMSVLRAAISRIGASAKPLGMHSAIFKQISGRHTMYDDLVATNPNYQKGYRWQNNCQRCVTAYEARRRGFDVEAKPLSRNGEPLMYMDGPNGWPYVYDGPSIVQCRAGTGIETRTKVEKEMALYGDGARAIVRVVWKNTNMGHVFVAEQVGGRTVFIDPQNGSPNCSDYFFRADGSYTCLMRVDNKPFTGLVYKCCRERKK